MNIGGKRVEFNLPIAVQFVYDGHSVSGPIPSYNFKDTVEKKTHLQYYHRATLYIILAIISAIMVLFTLFLGQSCLGYAHEAYIVFIDMTVTCRERESL